MLLYSHKEVLHMFKFEKFISKSAVRHLLMDSDLAREYPPALLENGIWFVTRLQLMTFLVDFLDRDCKTIEEREQLACRVYNTVVKVRAKYEKIA